jgi:hypothetical protein
VQVLIEDDVRILGGGIGARGYIDMCRKPGRDEERKMMTNGNASVSSSASAGEYEEYDEERRAVRKRGKGKQQIWKAQSIHMSKTLTRRMHMNG